MKNTRYLLTGLILLGLLSAFVLLVKKNQSVSTVKVSAEDRKAKGPANAPVQIVEYSDFQCPACAYGAKQLHRYLKIYPGQVRVDVKYFPLGGHMHSMEAAKFADEEEGGHGDLFLGEAAKPQAWLRSITSRSPRRRRRSCAGAAPA